MKRCSSISDGLLDPLFESADVGRRLSDTSLLRALLDVESALAQAEADAGVIPIGAAKAIAEACTSTPFDVAQLGIDAQGSGNPVVPLVRALGAALPEDARPWVHLGATSQDILDTAFMLLARRSGVLMLADGDAAADACAELVAAHRDTVMVARTLGQQAGLTTFGLKAAGWLTSLDESVARLREVLQSRLAVQLGGAAGTLGVLGDAGVAMSARFAYLLDLAEPVLPWHTNRQRVLELAAALGGVVAACGKLALDVELLAQTEIAEVGEGAGTPGGQPHGGSSALPHKHNPVDAVLIRSAAYRAPGLLSALFFAASHHEHERAAGAWHAEWESLRELLRVTGGALARTGSLVSALSVHADRMRATVDAAGGLLMTENVASALAPALGRAAAQALVGACAARALERGATLRDVMASDADVLGHLSPAELDAAFDPGTVLKSAGVLIDRALAAHAGLR